MSADNWFVRKRQRWIGETLYVFGFINREHIMRKFSVSVAQASLDLREYQAANPDIIAYNKQAKRYESVAALRERGGDRG